MQPNETGSSSDGNRLQELVQARVAAIEISQKRRLTNAQDERDSFKEHAREIADLEVDSQKRDGKPQDLEVLRLYARDLSREGTNSSILEATSGTVNYPRYLGGSKTQINRSLAQLTTVQVPSPTPSPHKHRLKLEGAQQKVQRLQHCS